MSNLDDQRNLVVVDVSGAVEVLANAFAFAVKNGFESPQYLPGHGPIEAIAERLNGGPGQVVGRVHSAGEVATVVLNGLGLRLIDGTPLYSGVL